MKVIACYSIKGGVGKTASAVNIAYELANKGHKTLLIDLDPQGASSFYFRTRPKSKHKAGLFFMKKTKLMNNVRASDFKNLDILPAHMSYRNFDVMLDAMKKSTQRLRSQLGSLKKEYDAVILDCPPNISKLAENIFEASDLILVPVIPTTLSERTFEQLQDFFEENNYSKKKLHLFFTMVQKNKKLHSQTVSRMASTCKRVLESHIPFSSDVESMGIHRRPIAEYSESCKASKAYKALAQEIMKRAGLKK